MSVRSFALTYPQLMNRAMEQGLTENELARLRSGYEAAQILFDGLYRAQNVPFICHLVRTAAVLLEEKAPIEVVIAGLLHSAYSVGCFRDQKHGGASQTHREELARSIGEEAEELVFGYFNSSWYRKECIQEYLKNLETSDLIRRQVILIHLANELEDYLDFGMLYRGFDTYKKRIEAYGKEAVALALNLNCPVLAKELEEIFQAQLGEKLPQTVITSKNTSFQLPLLKWLKKSYSERLWIKSKEIFSGVGK